MNKILVSYAFIQWPLLPSQSFIITVVDPEIGSHIAFNPDIHKLSEEDEQRMQADVNAYIESKTN